MNLEGLAPFGFNPIYPDYELQESRIQIESAAPDTSQKVCQIESNRNGDIMGDLQVAAAIDQKVQDSEEEPIEEPTDETNAPNIKEVTLQELKQEISQLKVTCRILQEQLQAFTSIHSYNNQLQADHYDSDDPIQIWKIQWRSGFTVPIDSIPNRSVERRPRMWWFRAGLDQTIKKAETSPPIRF